MSVYTCYASLSGFGVQAVGPPAAINWTVNYEVCDTLTNELKLCASTSDYVGQIAASIQCPATQVQVRAAAEAAVQAAETGYPLLVFVWAATP